MIVYREQTANAVTAVLIAAVQDQSTVQETLIAYGEFEAAVADALSPERDTNDEELVVMRRAAVALGRWFEASRRGEKCSALHEWFTQAFAEVRELRLPRTVRTSVPEGYAFYGLYPESYSKAARQFVKREHPESVCVIGIRSIGASLSAAVAGALLAAGVRVHPYTVRPHGHPFDRELRVSEGLRADWQRLAKSSHFAVVDEGPGLSGSSFLSVARALNEAGIATDRIVLFPSWEADSGAFVSERAREAWPRYRKYCAEIEPPLPQVPLEDWSAGAWRNAMPAELRAELPSQPQHEARKYRTGDGRLFKFAGLGRFGRDKLRTAELLHEGGFSPRARGFDQGYLEYEFVPGRPATKGCLDAKFVQKMADYLAFRARKWPFTPRSCAFDDLLEMIATNAAEALGPQAAECENRLRRVRREFEDRPAIQVDGRMMPHEWIATSEGWLKTDAVDHCRDHFYPGYADPAWDLAGAIVEFQMNADERHHLLHRYTAMSRDKVSPAILDFYEIAYLAFRAGYTSLAAKATSGTPDRDLFGAMQLAYSCFLEQALAPDLKRRQVIA